MEKRFSLLSLAAFAFALALVFVVTTGAKAADHMNRKDTSSSSAYDRDTAAQDRTKPDASMSGMGHHAGMMDKESMAGKDKDPLEGLSAEQHKEYSLMPKGEREIISKLPENQRREFFSLNREERDKFFSYKPRERDAFLSLKPEERGAFISLTIREREKLAGFRPNERETFFSLSPSQRQAYASLKPEERHMLMGLNSEERSGFFSLRPRERHRFFSASSDERQRMISRAERRDEMHAKDTDKSSKDTERSMDMKSGENASNHGWHKAEMSGSEHDKGMSDKDVSKSSDKDMNKSSDKDMNRKDMEHQQNLNKSGGDTSGPHYPTDRGSNM